MNCFIYSWNICNNVIFAFGKNESDKNVLLQIPFQSYCYILLPGDNWEPTLLELVKKFISSKMGNNRPRLYVVTKKYRLYGAHLNPSTGLKKKFWFLKCYFQNKYHVYLLTQLLNKEVSIPGIGCAELRVFENSSNQILQLCCNKHLETAGWLQCPEEVISKVYTKQSLCDEEYIVEDWGKLEKNLNISKMPNLTICSFDIECVPEDRTKFPNPKMPNDICFQISCVTFGLNQSNRIQKYLLTISNGQVDCIDDCEILHFPNERKLLIGFSEFLRYHNINICIGYNIFQFDIPYLLERSKQTQCFDEFCKQGFLISQACKVKNIKWSSSAYQTQEYTFLDNEGRIFIDLLPVIQKEYKLVNYKLNTVSKHFLNEEKDDLKPEDINKCFDLFTSSSLALCGKYCIQDAVLVANLFNKLQIWYSLYSMANVCRVPISTLLLYGQQIKVYSAIYQYCTDKGIVVEKPDYKTGSNERYTGAYVFPPIPGLYENVVPFDFASLYPTTIIAYNIDYSTLVLDNDEISDDQCHIMEWEDHVNCIHDKKPSNTKSLCEKRRYRFLKEPKGVLPTIIADLLEKRRQTRKEMALVQDDLQKLVLNQRQLAYKVSANSMYGITGVKEGMLPLMPLAMCITYMGRENVVLAAKRINTLFEGQIVYGDTDSNYIIFPHISIEHLYEFGDHVSKTISKTFPEPIQLEFEEEVYSKFLIFTKKRYVYEKMDKNGKISSKLGKSGVLLCRRDTCKFIQDIYQNLIHLIFKDNNKEAILSFLTDEIKKLLTRQIDEKDLIMSKSFNDFNGDPHDGKMGAYKVKMSENKNVDKSFYIKQLPALCQLVDRMITRGDFKFEGRRLEYLMLKTGETKQADKIEHIDYISKNRDQLTVDYFYYFERLIEPVDQVLEIVFKLPNWTKTFFKFHLNTRGRLIKSINDLRRPILKFVKK